MSKLEFLIRKHSKRLTSLIDKAHNFKYNFKYICKCRYRKISHPNTFYFVIDPQRHHPGLADRLKAIISTYNEAKLNGLEFKIIHKYPFKLEEYLNPSNNNSNWIGNIKELEYSFQYTRFINENTNWHLNAKKGMQYHCYNYTGNILPEKFNNSGEKWSTLFHELFTPSQELQQAILNTGLIEKTYIAVHLRFVNALDNFEEGLYNNIKNEIDKLNLIKRCHDGINRIIEYNKTEGISKVVVFSDSERFLKSVIGIPNIIVLPPTHIGHISYNNSHNNIIKTFLDFFIISKATKVYRITAKEMYQKSCFALCAARVGDIEFQSITV